MQAHPYGIYFPETTGNVMLLIIRFLVLYLASTMGVGAGIMEIIHLKFQSVAFRGLGNETNVKVDHP